MYEELCSALGSWKFVKAQSFSQYFNPVHFEIGVDEQGHPVDLHTDQIVPDRQIAVQVYPEYLYTQDTK